ncbi:MAG TPA: type II secretion system minor pseudopilin GspK [Burkholderiales bacterium]|nr:type II secretion system minor pseudopilin GspK [Burkholderiales bacterium]
MNHRSQRGGAVVMAMLAVAIAATLVAGTFWRQEVWLQRVENELSFAQAQWLMRGVIDWARVILAEDARTSRVDHLGEPWALQIADTRLDDSSGTPAYLTGGMQDAQAKYNLRNLVGPDGIVPAELEVLRRLLAFAEVPETLANPIAQRVLDGVPAPAGEGGPASTGESLGARRQALPLRTLDDLLSVPQIGVAQVQALRPYLTVLPRPTPVNANTASAQVLAGTIADLSLPDARRLLASRDRAHFKDLHDVVSRMSGRPLQADPTRVGIDTQFFLMQGHIVHRRARLHAQALLLRAGNSVQLVWVREL